MMGYCGAVSSAKLQPSRINPVIREGYMMKRIENVQSERSQAPPTRLDPLGTSFKEALRLNRD